METLHSILYPSFMWPAILNIDGWPGFIWSQRVWHGRAVILIVVTICSYTIMGIGAMYVFSLSALSPLLPGALAWKLPVHRNFLACLCLLLLQIRLFLVLACFFSSPFLCYPSLLLSIILRVTMCHSPAPPPLRHPPASSFAGFPSLQHHERPAGPVLALHICLGGSKQWIHLYGSVIHTIGGLESRIRRFYITLLYTIPYHTVPYSTKLELGILLFGSLQGSGCGSRASGRGAPESSAATSCRTRPGLRRDL